MNHCAAVGLRFRGKGYEARSGSWKKMRRAISNCDIALYSSRSTASLLRWRRLSYTGPRMRTGQFDTWLYKGRSAESLQSGSCWGCQEGAWLQPSFFLPTAMFHEIKPHFSYSTALFCIPFSPSSSQIFMSSSAYDFYFLSAIILGNFNINIYGLSYHVLTFYPLVIFAIMSVAFFHRQLLVLFS